MHLLGVYLTRYFFTMNSNLLFATIWLSTAGALAQPGPSPDTGADAGAERAQRRADLRTALQPNRRPDLQTIRTYNVPPAARHLSARELAEMRQQLRQQRAEVSHLPP